MRPGGDLLTLARVLAVALALLPFAPASAVHVAALPHCENLVAPVANAEFPQGRVQALGYAKGNVGALNLAAVDGATPSPAPDVFEPGEPSPVLLTMQVVGAAVSLHFPGLENTILLGGPPTTTVRTDLGPLAGETTEHAGAQAISMVFSGRVTLWTPEKFRCTSVQIVNQNVTWAFSMQKVRLDGFALRPTSLENPEAAWGWAQNGRVDPGEARDW